MPVDMMVEAMKVVYTKSLSGHSKSSLFSKPSLSKGSQYGFFGSPSNSSRSAGSPSVRSTSTPSLHGAVSSHVQDTEFTASFLVKVSANNGFFLRFPPVSVSIYHKLEVYLL